jgi:transcriptional regulator with XRE-family HTH domain
MKPSEVFAYRLREIRMARRLTQTQLAELATGQGTRLSKKALLRLEKADRDPAGSRGLSLDEALALTAALNAVPAHLLTPPEGAHLALTNALGVDGAGLREFLLHGFPWNLDEPPGEVADDLQLERLQAGIVLLAQTLIDSVMTRDKDGEIAALRALWKTVQRYGEKHPDL